MRKIVATEKAPAAIGPYAQANIIGNLVITSGQIPIDPATGDLVESDIETQTRQVFAKMNEVYAEYFSGEYPSRSAVEVAKLPKGALIEIEAIAYL